MRTTVELVLVVATAAHAAWQKTFFAKPGNTSETPRVKATKDAEWIQKNGKNEVDIAHTSFPKLPTDWQGDNGFSAQVAVDAMMMEVSAQGDINSNDFMERAATMVHDAWLIRHKDDQYAEKRCFKPYAELDEDLKEADRLFVRLAVKAYGE